ncbi:MAG: conjugative transposon protein TraN [Bacteroidota bacterium]
MKSLIITLALLNLSLLMGQDIREIKINKDVTTHIISDEILTYTDISVTSLVDGDFPLENILRIKPKNEEGTEYGYVTIVGESFFKQFRLVYVFNPLLADKEVNINREPRFDYDHPAISLTSVQMKNYMKRMHSMRPKLSKKGKRANKMQLVLNNIWVVGEHYFIDYTIKNRTNIQYDIDEIRFKIDDKKVKKSSNSQTREMKPILKYNALSKFDKSMRQVVVLKKFTFPNEKEFRIEISEDQISGRVVSLDVSYKDILRARKLPVPNTQLAKR